jgi:hypothetical protein
MAPSKERALYATTHNLPEIPPASRQTTLKYLQEADEAAVFQVIFLQNLKCKIPPTRTSVLLYYSRRRRTRPGKDGYESSLYPGFEPFQRFRNGADSTLEGIPLIGTNSVQDRSI